MRIQTRHLVVAVPAALIMAAAAACSSSSGPSTGPSTTPATPATSITASGVGSGSTAGTAALTVTGNSTLGQIVTNGQGVTVYRYDLDTVNSGTSACTGSCATAWPPVTVTGSGTPVVSGVSQSLVGEITRSDGTKQLTIAGWPLYTYAGDSGPGSANGQGSGGIWWAVTPTGAKATSSTAGSSPSTGGGGGNY
ncbi:hypothetical protein KDL01_15890 [Actinospica durhamensis]|uniref:Lipoprotein with Yx(FWY)xxD motif n=1 Tax=Actinospica durhamensis TaxID=1508375 RepID=A0A941EQP2_9ACTN|nr:hypothetical protein [Actinospica durhamensis]MBR7834757.1 hypothetical protein [Actinospica durhamensis]